MKPKPNLEVTLVSTPGVTPEQSRTLRAHAWLYVFDCCARKKVAGASGTEEDTKHVKNEGRPA
jgi:hypothetical protein